LARLADSARAAAAVASCASVVPEWRVWLPGVHCWPNCAREAAPDAAGPAAPTAPGRATGSSSEASDRSG